MTTRRRREPIETATRGKQSNLPTTTSNHYACFQPFTRRVLQINPQDGTPTNKDKANGCNDLFLPTQSLKLLAREPINIRQNLSNPITCCHPLNKNTSWPFSHATTSNPNRLICATKQYNQLYIKHIQHQTTANQQEDDTKPQQQNLIYSHNRTKTTQTFTTHSIILS